jgi:putative nucleotidyltransferase with HDIG domain
LYRGEIDRAIFEKRYVHKTGGIVWCQLSVGMVHNREGKPLYFVTYIQNITEQKNNEQLIAQSNQQLQTAAMEAIECLGYVVETRDPYTSGHQRRVADLAAAIAAELDLPESQIHAVRVAGTVHDIGKMSIPAEILSKPTVLTEFERTFVQQHAESGYQILSRIHFPWPVAEIVYQHHESIDGSGYPRKLTGDAIMLEAKILSVADVVEAMSTHRPYRPALGVDAALEEILRYAGIKYDIDAVNACVKLFMDKGYQLLP